MKNAYSRTLLILAALTMLSCKDSIRIELPAPEDRMHIKVSSELVEVSFFNPDAEAVTFSWDDTGFKDEGIPYNYWFKMDISGNNFETSIDKRQVTGKNEISFTGVELKSFLNKWEVQDGIKARIAAEIIAEPVETGSIENQKYRKPEVSKVEFDLVCNTTLVLEVGDKNYTFTNDEVLTTVEAGTYTCRAGDDESIKVTVPQGGLWKFTVDFANRSVNVVRPRMWLLGNACSNGWDLPTMPEFSSESDGAVKTWQGMLKKGGEMKFALAINSTWNFNIPYIMPLKGEAPLENGDVQMVPSGSPDCKWKVSESGEYRISVNLENLTVSFTLVEKLVLKWDAIWMVGDATEGGWYSNPFRTKLKYDDTNSIKGHKGVFYIDLPLKAGQFKFPLEESKFEVPYLMPKNVGADGLAVLPQDGQSCAIKYVAAPGNPDHKWRVSEDRAGDYRLVVDTEEMTMTVYKK